MTKLDKQVYQQMLDPMFSFEDFDYDTYVGLASELVGSREMYQKVIGRMAYELKKKYPKKRVEDFTADISGSVGFNVPYGSITAYRWVYTRLMEVMPLIPEDLKYSAWKALAGTDNPREWLGKLNKEGWDGRELIIHIKESKGEKPHRQKFCAVCGAPQ